MSSPEGAARVLLGAEGGVLAAVHRLEVVARLGHGHHGRGHVPAPRLDSRAGAWRQQGARQKGKDVFKCYQINSLI